MCISSDCFILASLSILPLYSKFLMLSFSILFLLTSQVPDAYKVLRKSFEFGIKYQGSNPFFSMHYPCYIDKSPPLFEVHFLTYNYSIYLSEKN